MCQRVRNGHSSFRVTKQRHEKRKGFLQRKEHTKVLVLLQLTRLLLQGAFFTRGFSIGKIQAIVLYHREQVQEIATLKDPQGIFFRTSSGSLVLITWLSQWGILCIQNNSIPCKCRDNSDRHF